MTFLLTIHQIRSPHHFITSRFFTYNHGLLQQADKKPIVALSPQQLTIAQLCAEQNVVVSARPGSGKTATIEAIAAAYPDKQIGVFLPSKRHKDETSHRLKEYTNCHISTFHDMFIALFGPRGVALTDKIIRKRVKYLREHHKLPEWMSTPFDIIVLDEFQDCNPANFLLVQHLIRPHDLKKGNQPARIVVLGDERLSIDRFRIADPRYLTLAPQLLGPISPYPFAKVQLGESFEIPKPTVDFINRVFLKGEQYITSSKHGPKPVVLKCLYWNKDALAKKLIPLINHYGPENCAIIAPKVLKKSPVQYLANSLAEKHGIPISVPTDEETPLDDRVIKGKMCVSTIHQFKDCERDLVIVFGMDNSFFNKKGRHDLPDYKCPNETFVALTRALEQLVVVHNDVPDFIKIMPFVSVNDLYKTAKVVNMTNSKARIASNTQGRRIRVKLTLPEACEVSDLTRFIQPELLADLVNRYLEHRRISLEVPPNEFLEIPDVVPSDLEKGYWESVSDINSLVLLSVLELKYAGTLHTLYPNLGDVDKKPHGELSPWLCRRACEHKAYISGYWIRMIQMENHKFDWIEPKMLELAQRQLSLDEEMTGSVIGHKFALDMRSKFTFAGEDTCIKGRAHIITTAPPSDRDDGMNNSTILEVKLVPHLTDEHVVQACVKAYLLSQTTGKLPRIILYNIRTGDKREVTPRDGIQGLQHLITDLIRLRYKPQVHLADERFLELFMPNNPASSPHGKERR
ncbi:hypothetical protein NW762_002498 [Fusarium torreyae]|uniref:DNA helicase n=1 Tax=Fusarium torreyae TaxID=1237075 RepID=A0A9W8SAV7_9HYPO|nr:hypothetical protein NW762_002498 [Fusarium torreyae]